MSWGSGSSGSGRGGTPPGDGGAADRLGQVRAWLAEGAARLRDRASQRWRERVEPDPLAEPAPAAWGSEPAAPPAVVVRGGRGAGRADRRDRDPLAGAARQRQRPRGATP